MRTILMSSLLVVTACSARSTGFDDDVAAAVQRTSTLRRGFTGIAGLEPKEKGKVLRKVVERTGVPLLAHLEALTPPPAKADCAADAVGGARRSVGAMQDMVKLYDAGHFDDLFGARIVASARNADEGLATIEDRLRACGAR